MKGLYGITEEDIEETRRWEEWRITIDIEKKTLDFDVLWEYTLKNLLEEYEVKEEEIKEININFKNIPFEEVFDLKAFIDKANYNEQYKFFNKFDNKYIGLIQ